MKIRYVGKLKGPVDVPAFGLTVTPGETVDVPTEQAKQLLQQSENWTKVPAKKKAKE